MHTASATLATRSTVREVLPTILQYPNAVTVTSLDGPVAVIGARPAGLTAAYGEHHDLWAIKADEEYHEEAEMRALAQALAPRGVSTRVEES